MEIINSDQYPIVEPAKADYSLILVEDVPTELLDPSTISDKNWDVFEFVKKAIPEAKPVQALEIAERVEEFRNFEVFRCLKVMWQASLIRRFYKMRYRRSKIEPRKSQIWYLVQNVKDYVLPDLNKLREWEKSKRPRGYRSIPDEVVAKIRGYGPEVTIEWIARKHEISIFYTERIRYYAIRKHILPQK